MSNEPRRWNGDRLAALADVRRSHVRRAEGEAFPLAAARADDRALATLAAREAGEVTG
jgi:methenyltetrahydromethanopterin cyclohydrolase